MVAGGASTIGDATRALNRRYIASLKMCLGELCEQVYKNVGSLIGPHAVDTRKRRFSARKVANASIQDYAHLLECAFPLHLFCESLSYEYGLCAQGGVGGSEEGSPPLSPATQFFTAPAQGAQSHPRLTAPGYVVRGSRQGRARFVHM